MNYRSQPLAMVLCFFLGLFGAHWFYLGRSRWGVMYLVAGAGFWPFQMLAASLADIHPALPAVAIALVWLAEIVLWAAVLYDFCCLLSMHPRRFDAEFNN